MTVEAPVTHDPKRRPDARSGEPTVGSATSPASGKAKRRAGPFAFSRISGVYLWILLITLFAVWLPSTFFTELTAKNIAGEQAVTAIIALGLLFPLAAGVFDLSIGFVVGFSNVFAAWLLVDQGASPALTVVLTLCAGVVIGLINGTLVVVVGVDSFIATLAVSSVLSAMILMVSDNAIIPGLPSDFTQLSQSQPLGVPVPVFYMVALAIVVWIVLEHTPVGRRFYATGAGREAARLAGVRTNAITFLSLVLSATIASLAGVIVVAKLGTGSPQLGPNYLLPVFAAVFFSTTQFHRGRFNVPGTILAVYFLATGVKGLQLAGGQVWLPDLFNGLALIIAVTAAALSGGASILGGIVRRGRLARIRETAEPAVRPERSGARTEPDLGCPDSR